MAWPGGWLWERRWRPELAREARESVSQRLLELRAGSSQGRKDCEQDHNTEGPVSKGSLEASEDRIP